MRPADLGGVGLHALGMGSLGWCNFSRSTRQRIHHYSSMVLANAIAAAMSACWVDLVNRSQSHAGQPQGHHLT